MNTETKVHEYQVITSNRACGQTVAQEIYARAYNAGKSDAILEFVDMVKKDIKKLLGRDLYVHKEYLFRVLDSRKDEVLKNQISKVLEDSIKEGGIRQ